MKSKFTLALLILLYSCKMENQIFSLVPIEYTFSQNDLGKGKTFVYVDRSNGEYSYTELYNSVVGKKKYLVQRSYSNKGGSDSIIYLNNKMIEAYSYMFSKEQPTKAEIILDTLTKNGRRYGKRTLIVNFHTDSTVLSMTTEAEYLKDTTFTWNGKLIPTLIIKNSYHGNLKSKFNTDVYSDFKIDYLSYEAKGIGTIRMKFLTTMNNKNIITNKIKLVDLIQIKERSI